MSRAAYLRLMRPPGGIESSELDILPNREFKRIRQERELSQQRKRGLIERWHSAKRVKLVIHRNPQKVTPLPTPIEPTLVDPAEIPRLTVRAIAQACGAYYQISMAEMLSRRRHKRVVRVRQLAMYLAKEHTFRSFPEIGRLFAGRDHTTVLHAHRVVAQRLINDERFRGEVGSIRLQLGIVVE